MKTPFSFYSFLFVVLFGSAAAQAQPASPGRVAPNSRAVPGRPAPAKAEGIKDGLSMMKGRVVLTELGINNPLIADKKLTNGTIITPAGLVTGTDGTTAQMMEGDHVSLSGRITSRSEIMAADSIAKIQLFDALHPGKRKKMEELAEKKAKMKEKLTEQRAKVKEKAAKRRK
ncbi:MAG: hypothetical protein M3Y12_10385 [Bacteroidota bacterium]|nr:hypothetical protein [Bacteroidota bacterium]